ncbi:GTP cyclohydrolase II [Arthrobacter sp. H20]|uniref:GTP cyclohydrolase II n=1 Tax=Arthrobacter sp. H20 TaxID=1267981 RepID=UPI000479DADC|nr:GTP cyclohydrolase II [Arthrobacter sp. H20]
MSIESAPGWGASQVERVVETVLPTRYGVFRMVGYRDSDDNEHVALVRGDIEGTSPLVRVHSECLTGDTLGSYRCDCGEQLDASLQRISDEGAGIVIYVRGHEGRGIGLLEKLRAYALQDQGVDTVDANTSLGLPVDARDYEQSTEILRDLGVTRLRLLSSNPAKQEALESGGITVTSRSGLFIAQRPENADYIATKRARMRHDGEPVQDVWRQLTEGIVPQGSLHGLAADLLTRYGPLVQAIRPDGRLVIGQLGQSLDGFIASRTGDARFVTGSEDREHLHRLRALVDAVVIGASTVTADDCLLTVRAVEGTNPVRVVLDPQGRIPHASAVLTDGAAPTLWLVGSEAVVPVDLAGHVGVKRLAREDFEPHRLLELLADLGHPRVLVEGGGHTVSRFLEAGALDRLYLTSAPILVGDGVPGIRFTGSDALSDALSAPVRRFEFGRDVCTEFDFSAAVLAPVA